MNPEAPNSPLKRLAKALTAVVAVSIVALAPAIGASMIVTDQSVELDEPTESVATIDITDIDQNATVMYASSIPNRMAINDAWHSANIIRNGVLIRENRVHPAGLPRFGKDDEPAIRNIPTSSDVCASIIQELADEINIQKTAGWYVVSIEIVDDNSGTLRRCSIPLADAAK